MTTAPKARRRRRLAKIAKLGLATAVATATLVGVGAAAASASPLPSGSGAHTQDDTITVTAYTKDLSPWQTVSLPAFACPADYPYLVAANFSPGVIVPPGVKVEQTGAVGVYINGEDLRFGYKNGTYYWWGYGTLANGVDGDIASATNWDPLHDHRLQIDLNCTSNFVKGGGYPS